MTHDLHRSRPGVRLCTTAAVLLTLGCASHRQVQYFAATDPDTGSTNYYKMTIRGGSGGGTDYHLQAGYFSAAAVDVLRGSMPKVPVLDLPVDQVENFDALTQRFYARLMQDARVLSPISDPEARLAMARGRIKDARAQLIALQSGRITLDSELRITKHDVAQTESTVEKARKDRDDAAEALKPGDGGAATPGPAAGTASSDAINLRAARQRLDGATRALVEAEQQLATLQHREEEFMIQLADTDAAIAMKEAAIQAAELVASKLQDDLLNSGGELAEGGRPKRLSEEEVIDMARLIWLGSLSKSDLASIGMTENLDPFQFRKLVFWATANNIDLQAYASEIDGVIDNVVTIAETAKRQAAERKANQRSKQNSLKAMINTVVPPQYRAGLNQMIDPEGTATPGDAGTGGGQ